MDDKKKKYCKPNVEVVEYEQSDVILTSNPFEDGTDNAEEWEA